MKIHMKIIGPLLLILSIFLTQPSESATAAYDFTNLGCVNEQGRDIIFVIQDTPDMQKHDSEKSRVTEVLKVMDLAERDDRFGLIGFNTKITKELSLTTNTLETKRVLNTFGSSIEDVEGYDLSVGLYKAVDELSKKSTSNDKIIVVLTVGTSINNELSLEIAEQAYEEDIKIQTISFGDPLSVDSGTLKQIAENTGGNYNHSPNAAYLSNLLSKLDEQVLNFTGREVGSDWTLTQDVHEKSGLLLKENVKVDLNGYDLKIDGDLILLSCSELRAVSGDITAKNIEQKSRSTIRLNNSQLNVTNQFRQDGVVSVNGDYRGVLYPEVKVNQYNQRIHGYLDVSGQTIEITSNFTQEGRVDLEKGKLSVRGNLLQKGYFNIQQGLLKIDGNLAINGGPLVDEAFTKNKSLNVGGGVVEVGLDDGIGSTGNVQQLSGQLYVNHGTVEIFGDYSITDGWLTMVNGSMDTTVSDYKKGDGDYVHVHGNFSTESKRNHSQRDYTLLSKLMNDQGHLTDGVLEVEGNFSQIGDRQYHNLYSDKSQNYKQDYSRYNFSAAGRHKVLMTGKGTINIKGSGFQFNILEVKGRIGDYMQSGPVKWNSLIERSVAANSKLASLIINDKAVTGFNPDVMTYNGIVVASDSSNSGIHTLKIVARAEDHRNAKVEVLNNVVNSDGTAVVKVLVTAHDLTSSVYTVNLSIGSGSGGKVTSIELDREELLFSIDGAGFKPKSATIGHTVFPKNAINQQVNWTSTNSAVATVNPNGIVTPNNVGETTIIAKTADGEFMDAVAVKVLTQSDLLEGIKTLADLVSDNDRYNNITSGLYDMKKLGIVVPGGYIRSVQFSQSGNLVVGRIHTDITATPLVERVEVRVNGQQLGSSSVVNNEEFLFTRTITGIDISDYIEVIAYDSVGNELERVSSSYPVNFVAGTPIASGFYSLQSLLNDPITFGVILDHYSPEQLRFVAN